jgi:glutathione peroxidase
VKGDKKAPIYNWLISSTGGDDIEWNFAKFLIDQKGQIVERWKPDVKPDSSEVSIAVEKLLTKK